MEGIEAPIVAGAQFTDSLDNPVRVKSVWVDTDGTVQVQVFDEDTTGYPKHRTVALDDLTERIGDSLTRVNSDHEAWEWRQK